jgi:serine/threonine-protein kinase
LSIDIPHFRIITKLGEGAGSVIYLGRDIRNGARYAIKHVKLHTPDDMRFVDQLKDEYECGRLLDHPVIRKVFELRYVRRRLRINSAMLFMEYVDGMPMNAPEFSRPIPELLRLFIRAAEGLTAMHKAGFVHADLKPGNTLVTAAGEVKLIDLGQASRAYHAKSRIQGTIDYIAPEQASRDILDPRTDVFGLGATLYRLLTGKAIPTDMNQHVSMLTTRWLGKSIQERDEELAPVPLPAAIERFIEACCHKEPARRLPDMRAVIERLDMLRTIMLKHERQAAAAAAERRHTHRRVSSSGRARH